MIDDNLEKNPKLLMDSAKKGSSDAFGVLYEIYFKPVFRYIYLRLNNRTEAEDLTQIVFLKTYKSIQSFCEKGKSPLAYFFTVARNTVIDFWRKKKEIKLGNEKETLENIPSAEDTSATALQNETTTILNEALKILTDDQQEIIILKFINELSNQEIAGILDKNEDAVRQSQCRALKTLRQYFKNHGK
jgi:RNA polymerase sigma-70 factor (ECF subfamily)